jgi:tight adherence protein C
VLLIVGAATFGAAMLLLTYGLLAPSTKRRNVAGALVSIEKHYRHRAVVAERASEAGEQTKLPTWSRDLALRLSPSGGAGKLQRRLDLAGNPAGWTADRVLAMKGLGLIIGAVLGALLGIHRPALAIVFAIIGAVCLFFLPDVLLYNRGIKRQEAVLDGLPDALDMLSVCVEAGLGFDSALSQVARNTRGPLAEEFARALQEMQIGLSRVQALRAVAERTTVVELRSFISAFVQASELGVPVARVLREQTGEMRVRRRQRAEERAQKVPVKIMFPVVACLFPALLVVIVGPGVISIAHALFHVHV